MSSVRLLTLAATLAATAAIGCGRIGPGATLGERYMVRPAELDEYGGSSSGYTGGGASAAPAYRPPPSYGSSSTYSSPSPSPSHSSSPPPSYRPPSNTPSTSGTSGSTSRENQIREQQRKTYDSNVQQYNQRNRR